MGRYRDSGRHSPMHEGSAAQQNPITSSQGTKPISLPTSMAGMMALSGFCRRDRPKIDQLSGTVPLIALALEDHQACMRVYMCMCICIEREGSGRPPASGSVRTLHLPAVHLPLVLSRPSPAASPVAHTCTCTRAQPSISRCIASGSHVHMHTCSAVHLPLHRRASCRRHVRTCTPG